VGKLLILAWGVYPNTGGSTIIVNNIAEGYTKEELCIAGQAPAELPERRWEDVSDINLHYLNPFPINFRRPEKYIRWLKVRSIIRDVKRIVEEEKVDRILAIFPDEYYSYIAMKVSQECSIPFSIWFHNSYLENRSGIRKVLAQFLQPKFFSQSKNVFAMSDGLREEMKRVYPDVDIKTLVHGFKMNPTAVKEAPKDGKVRFLYSGSLNESCKDASLRLLNVIKRNPNYIVYIYSGNPQTFREFGIEGNNIVFRSFLPLDEFVAQLWKYDVMLLPHGLKGAFSDMEYRTIFPTRTIPLLFSGKPILAHSPKESFLSDFLRKHDCSVLVDEADEEQIEKAIEQILSNKKLVSSIVRNALNASRQFELDSVVSRLEMFV